MDIKTSSLEKSMKLTSKQINRSGSNTSNEIRYSLVGMYHSTSNTNFESATINFSYKNKTPKDYYNQEAQKWEK